MRVLRCNRSYRLYETNRWCERGQSRSAWAQVHHSFSDAGRQAIRRFQRNKNAVSTTNALGPTHSAGGLDRCWRANLGVICFAFASLLSTIAFHSESTPTMAVQRPRVSIHLHLSPERRRSAAARSGRGCSWPYSAGPTSQGHGVVTAT